MLMETIIACEKYLLDFCYFFAIHILQSKWSIVSIEEMLTSLCFVMLPVKKLNETVH